MRALAPTVQAFFAQRLLRERNASPHTIAAYRRHDPTAAAGSPPRIARGSRSPSTSPISTPTRSPGACQAR